LTRKEIAAILGVTTEAIKKSRSRLRKKLGLPSELRLEIYLKQI
jgi:DNA-binding CsgD family transcriptional regulator